MVDINVVDIYGGRYYGRRLWSETASEHGLQCLNMLIKRLKYSYICSGEGR